MKDKRMLWLLCTDVVGARCREVHDDLVYRHYVPFISLSCVGCCSWN
jgi:hypothetical protein